METRSKAKAAQLQTPSVNILESPGSRSPTEAEDLGLAAMMGDGEAPILGGGQPEVRATTSSLEDIPAATEWAPAWERTVENSTPPPSTRELELPATISLFMISEQIPAPVGTATARIPTLISSGPGAQAEFSDWPPRASEFENVKSTECDDYYVADVEHDMYWDKNIDPYHARNVTCRQMYADRREFSAFQAPVPPHLTDKSRKFRPLDRGNSRDSSCSRDSRPKSRGSSRATSRASVANFEWIGDFMKKFADDAYLREQCEAGER